MDVSADLTELGRTPVTVVSAGIKSILDIQRTLEYLVSVLHSRLITLPSVCYVMTFMYRFYGSAQRNVAGGILFCSVRPCVRVYVPRGVYSCLPLATNALRTFFAGGIKSLTNFSIQNSIIIIAVK